MEDLEKKVVPTVRVKELDFTTVNVKNTVEKNHVIQDFKNTGEDNPVIIDFSGIVPQFSSKVKYVFDDCLTLPVDELTIYYVIAVVHPMYKKSCVPDIVKSFYSDLYCYSNIFIWISCSKEDEKMLKRNLIEKMEKTEFKACDPEADWNRGMGDSYWDLY